MQKYIKPTFDEEEP